MSEDQSLDFKKSLENAKQSIGKVFGDIMLKSRERLKCLQEISIETATVAAAETVMTPTSNTSEIASKVQKKKASPEIIEVDSKASTTGKK